MKLRGFWLCIERNINEMFPGPETHKDIDEIVHMTSGDQP